MSEKEKVEGYVEHIIFRNEENGYTVLNLSMKGRELTCVGTLPMIGEGELIEASGDYIEHAAYGKQFRIESYETKVPQDSVALERYLDSGAIKGVGAALAARIVRRFGDDTLRIIEEEPERLAEVNDNGNDQVRDLRLIIFRRQVSTADRNMSNEESSKDNADRVAKCKKRNRDTIKSDGRECCRYLRVPLGCTGEEVEACTDSGKRTCDGHGENNVSLLADAGVFGSILIEPAGFQLIAEGCFVQNNLRL